MEAAGGREKGRNVEEEKTVAIFVCQNTNMSREQQQRGKGGADPATEMQLALVREVVEVWGTPITEERKNWTTEYLEKRLQKKHDGKLTTPELVPIPRLYLRPPALPGPGSEKKKGTHVARF